jgi:hypothetical protein
MEVETKNSGKFQATRVSENTITVTRRKSKNTTYEVDVYVFSPSEIAELKSVKPSEEGVKTSLFSRVARSFQYIIAPLLIFSGK